MWHFSLPLAFHHDNNYEVLWFLPRAKHPVRQSTLRSIMNNNEFKRHRARLDKTQKQMAELRGTSLKTIHSYEQGWRSVPVHVERPIYFL
jgi:hypothetical protein